VIFRTILSDLIASVYSKMEPSHAAADFLHRIRENCAGILADGRDALVPSFSTEKRLGVYYRNGRPFCATVPAHQRGPRHAAVTVSEGLRHRPGVPGPYLSGAGSMPTSTSGSARGGQRSLDQLCALRATYDVAAQVPLSSGICARRAAHRRGRDWCWWYGPEHDSANRVEFDQLYRSHLANVYRFLDLTPRRTSRPILRMAARDEACRAHGADPRGNRWRSDLVFEWLGAGLYRGGRT